MANSLMRKPSQRSSAQAKRAATAHFWELSPSVGFMIDSANLRKLDTPEVMRRTPQPTRHRSLRMTPQPTKPTSLRSNGQTTMGPSYLQRFENTSNADFHLSERFVGWYDHWQMNPRILLRYGFRENPLYEIVTATEFNPRELVSLFQIPSILEMQVAPKNLIWGLSSRVTNVARGGIDRSLLWVEIDHTAWLPRSWLRNLKVEGGGVLGKQEASKYIMACIDKKEAWYAHQRDIHLGNRKGTPNAP